MSELGHQIRNYSNFTWINGSFLLDWLIHDIDVCCWIKDAWPVSVQGHGGRQVRPSPINCSTTTPWNTALPTARGCSSRAATWPAAGNIAAMCSTAQRVLPSAMAGASVPDLQGAQADSPRRDLEICGPALQ